MKKAPRILLASLALTGAAFAQSNTPQAAPAAPAPAATAPSVDPAKLALARETIKAMQADKMIDAMSTNLRRIISQVAAAPADATPEKRAKAEVLSNRLMELSMEAAKGMIAKMDVIYAEIYTEAELKAVHTFFISVEGQSMIAKQPQVMQQMMPLVQSMQRELMSKMQKLVEESKAEEAAAAQTAAMTGAPAAKPEAAPAK